MSSASAAKPAAAAAAAPSEAQPPADGSPISAGDATNTAMREVASQIYAGIRERVRQNQYFLSIAAPLNDSLQKEFTDAGYKVFAGRHSTLIEWGYQ